MMERKRVLLVNKFYYNRGGAEVVTLTLRAALEAAGYRVGVLTMDYHSNLEGSDVYTVPEVSFKTGGIGGRMAFARRAVLGDDTAAALRRVLREFHPSVVHLHNIHSYLSPAVAREAKRAGCRVVWTLHDYKLICPAYSCLNRGATCERCFRHKRHILATRCFKQSIAASTLAWLEATRWSRHRLERWTDAWVCPSEFMRHQMTAGGFNPAKMHVINNFLDPDKLQVLTAGDAPQREPFLLYAGRLSAEKGVTTLLEAMRRLPGLNLKLCGNGPLRRQLEAQYAALPNVEFLGQRQADDVARLQQSAAAVVVPSEWYENNPLSVIEAHCAGTPVVGADIGGIPELITPDNGIIFPAGDGDALADALTRATSRRWNHAAIATAARARYSAARHLAAITPLYFPDN